MSGPQIVVLTPVRNEAWILPRFLSVCSEFADLIVVSDQGSTDGSRDIYRRYPKVHVIDNPDSGYDEASRQIRLIETARTCVSGPRVLLAFDSDEVLAADAPSTEAWRRMLSAQPGTVLYFEKPDLLGTPHRAIRYENLWPLGYVDDGYPHQPKKIHSIRVPRPPHAEHLHLPEIQVLHYALTRPGAQRAKMRYYAVLENLNGGVRFYSRRRSYSANRDFSLDGAVKPSEPRWFARWADVGIDMFTVREEAAYWQDFEVLKTFAKHGSTRFWLDDIWDADWDALAAEGRRQGIPEIESLRVRPPPRVFRQLLTGVDGLYRLTQAARQAVRAAPARSRPPSG